MAVPEASMKKNDATARDEHEVWLTDNITPVRSISIS